MISSIIDVGTNSIKLAVARITADGFEILAEATTNPRLGENVDTAHCITLEAYERSIVAISQLLATARAHGSDLIRVIGTSALRDANNRDEIIDRVKSELGVELEVLSEEDECRLSYKAIALDPVLGEFSGNQIVADVGGGSTELVFGNGREMLGGKSVRIGAVRLTERHLKSDPPSAGEVNEADIEAIKLIREVAGEFEASRAVGVGGSAITLVRVLKGNSVDTIEGVHASAIARSELWELIEAMSSMSLDERTALVGLEPERADIILGGAIILDAVMGAVKADTLVVSARGLRHGALYDESET